MKKAVCPNDPEHKRFITTAHEVHDWIVDENGDFMEDLGAIETTVRPVPGNGNIWRCKDCGAEAEMKDVTETQEGQEDKE